MPSKKIPFQTKSPAYDSYYCECGSITRRKAPCDIERHKSTAFHKNYIATKQDEGQTIQGT